MVRIGEVWDRTASVLAGRPGMLCAIAFLTLILPDILRTAVVAVLPPVAASIALLPFALAVAALALIGQLALIAAASDPAMRTATALGLAARRLGAALAVVIVVAVVTFVLLVPLGMLLVAAGVVFAPDGTVTMPGAVDVTRTGYAFLYGVVLGLMVLAVGARLLPLWPVVLHERRGIGAFARAWRLTRGMTGRLIGVLLLWAIVLAVVVLATVGVVGSVAALVFGSASPVAALLVSLLTSLVGAGAAIVQATFTAQLHGAIIERARGDA